MNHNGNGFVDGKTKKKENCESGEEKYQITIKIKFAPNFCAERNIFYLS